MTIRSDPRTAYWLTAAGRLPIDVVALREKGGLCGTRQAPGTHEASACVWTETSRQTTEESSEFRSAVANIAASENTAARPPRADQAPGTLSQRSPVSFRFFSPVRGAQDGRAAPKWPDPVP